MKTAGEPSKNLLAQAGVVSNEAGRIFVPPCGALVLPWLLEVSKEEARQARERLQRDKAVPDDIRFAWFIASTEAEFSGLQFLLQADWRRALKAWQANSLYQVHNRATLHRALYLSNRSERPDAHIRECLRLYHHLSEMAPKQSLYRTFQEELIENLKDSIRQSLTDGDDESAGKSMRLLGHTVGLVGVEHLQEQFFGPGLNDFRIQCAKLQKELLSFQGVAHIPSQDLLERCDHELSQNIIPLAARFSRKLVEGSKERNEVEHLAAQACGILSQSYVKAGDNRGAKRWIGEALRWEPSAVEDWRSLPDEVWDDSDSAVVRFPEKVKEIEESPQSRGNFFFGIQAVTVKRETGVAREECLESLFVGFLPLFPIRRFAAYRNLETGVVGYYLRIPMSILDHLRQGLTILLLSFVLTVGVLAAVDYSKRGGQGDGSTTVEVSKEQIEEKLEKLKRLAQKEAELNDLNTLNPEQEKTLKAYQAERMRVIRELEELEKQRSR